MIPLSQDSVPHTMSGFTYSSTAANSDCLSKTLLQLTVRIRRLVFFGRLNEEELEGLDAEDLEDLLWWRLFLVLGRLSWTLGLLVVVGEKGVLEEKESRWKFSSLMGL